MGCAVVSKDTWSVINLIVADPKIDAAPEGCILVGITVTDPCDIGWTYDPTTETIVNPNPPSDQEAAG